MMSAAQSVQRQHWSVAEASGVTKKVVVSKDGKGECTIIAAALESIPLQSTHRTIIHIRAGVYRYGHLGTMYLELCTISLLPWHACFNGILFFREYYWCCGVLYVPWWCHRERLVVNESKHFWVTELTRLLSLGMTLLETLMTWMFC